MAKPQNSSRANDMVLFAQKRILPQFHWNFYRVHLTYFVLGILFGSVILYASGRHEQSEYNLAYIDALSLAASAMTLTGLNVVNLGALESFQQAVLFALMLMGNLIIVSFSTVLIRRFYFKKQIKNLLAHSKAGRNVANSISQEDGAIASSSRAKIIGEGDQSAAKQCQSRKASNHHDSINKRQSKQSGMVGRESKVNSLRRHESGFGGLPAPWEMDFLKNGFSRLSKRRLRQTKPNYPYLSFEPSFDHRGRFHMLKDHEREELGGVEYRALRLLEVIIGSYLLFWLLVPIVILVPWSYYGSISTLIRTSQPGDLSPGWWASFTVISGFSNCGLNLLDANFTSLDTYYLPVIVIGAVITAGNAFFPIYLRLAIWALSRMVSKTSSIHHDLMFLLDHPRRCFLFLFPATNTWYLLAVQLILDLAYWILFEVLDIGTAIATIGVGPRILAGIFQAIATRTGGFYIVTISTLAPAMLVFILVAMYVSNYPVIISMRHTNVYEERALGLNPESSEDTEHESEKSYISSHVKQQLAYDIWWLILAWFLICIIERHELVGGNPSFSTFNILFEIVSAYGTVGLSTGVVGDEYSFSGLWHVGSKLILITVMLRGRHRGLPMAIDRSVLLPGQELMERMDKHYNKENDGEIEKIRQEESGGQAEKCKKGQDPEEDENSKEGRDTRKKFEGSTEEG